MDILEQGLAAKNFAMLGLGDIVIPGTQKLIFLIQIMFLYKVHLIPLVTITFHKFDVIFLFRHFYCSAIKI
jgi:hypothetical protein